MSGIYIPGMEMPTSCFQCEFRTKIDPENLMCIISQKTFEERFYHIEHRDQSCPIATVPEQRWIPVTEQLPNENDDVLIYGEWTGASGTKYREIWLTDLKGFLHQGYKPIAWMPLPESPKEETE